MTEKIDAFEDLQCYQVAREFWKNIGRLAKELPKEVFKLKGQIRRASRSVAANIAKGLMGGFSCFFGRNSQLKSMNTVVSEKGQITIPKHLRDNLGLKAGTVLDFTEEAGRLVAIKRMASDPVSCWRGKAKLPGGGTVNDYLQRVRNGA